MNNWKKIAATKIEGEKKQRNKREKTQFLNHEKQNICQSYWMCQTKPKNKQHQLKSRRERNKYTTTQRNLVDELEHRRDVN